MNKKFWLSFLLVIGLTIGVLNSGGRAQNINTPGSSRLPAANTWYVSTYGNDSNDCATSLTPCAKIKAAVTKAVSGDEIVVASGVYTNTVAEDKLIILFSLSISGGWNETFSSQDGMSTVEGQLLGACLQTNPGIDVTINRFVLQHCGRYSNPYGGEPGIDNSARLIITGSIIQNGFNIQNTTDGELSMLGSIVRNNYSDDGGGISSFGKLFLNSCAISHNRANFQGGGLVLGDGQTVIINSTINDNISQWIGGAIYNNGTGSLSLFNSTIIHNQAKLQTGGLEAINQNNVVLYNSILAENRLSDPPFIQSDCYGTINSGGHNLVGTTSGCTFIPAEGDLLNTAPLAGPLDTYYALSPISPAIDAGNPAGCLDDLGNPILTDQRGTIRPLDGNGDGTATCDIGAYEFDPSHPPLFTFLPFANHPCPIFYFDDFSDPSSGWPVVDNGKTLLEYNNGEYRMMARPANWGIATHPAFKLNIYKVNVDVRNVTGVEGSYGIIFAVMPDWSGFYSFEIYPDGFYGIYLYDYNGVRALAEGSSPAIKQGTATNHLLLENEGNIFHAYANGQKLVDVTNYQFYGQLYIGLITLSYTQPNVDIRFDNFKVGPMNCTDVRPSGLQINPADASWIENSSDSSGKLPAVSRHKP